MEMIQGLGQNGHSLRQLPAAAVGGQFPGHGNRRRHAGAAAQRHGEKLLPLAENGRQLIPLQLFHGDQNLKQAKRVPPTVSLDKISGLRQPAAALRQKLHGLSQPTAAALRCGGYVLGAGLGKGFAQSFDDHRQGQRLQLELDAAGAHRGQQPVRIVRQKEKDSVNRRFFQHLQKGVLSGRPRS